MAQSRIEIVLELMEHRAGLQRPTRGWERFSNTEWFGIDWFPKPSPAVLLEGAEAFPCIAAIDPAWDINFFMRYF